MSGILMRPCCFPLFQYDGSDGSEPVMAFLNFRAI